MAIKYNGFIAAFLLLACLAYTFADTFVRVNLTVKCSLDIDKFNGSASIWEEDQLTGVDKISDSYFFPRPDHEGRRVHKLVLTSYSSNDGFGDDYLEPYVRIKHNCHNKQSRNGLITTDIDTPLCYIPGHPCYYDVDVDFGHSIDYKVSIVGHQYGTPVIHRRRRHEW